MKKKTKLEETLAKILDFNSTLPTRQDLQSGAVDIVPGGSANTRKTKKTTKKPKKKD